MPLAIIKKVNIISRSRELLYSLLGGILNLG